MINQIKSAPFLEAQMIFQQFDRYKQKKLDYSQLKYALRANGFAVKKEEAKQLFEEYNENGYIFFHNYWEIVSQKVQDRMILYKNNIFNLYQNSNLKNKKIVEQERKQEKEIDIAFECIDQNKKGFISWQDLKTISQQIGEDVPDSQIQQLVYFFDEGGEISKKQFRSIIQNYEPKYQFINQQEQTTNQKQLLQQNIHA